MLKKFFVGILLLAVGGVAAQEFSLEGEAKEELHQQLNSWTSIHLGAVNLSGEPTSKLEVGLGSWLSSSYGWGALIQFMPGSYNGKFNGKLYSVDFRSLSLQGEYLLWGNGFVEVSIPHKVGVGLARIYTKTAVDEVISRSEGFVSVSGGLGFDFPLDESFELCLRGDWSYVPYLDESPQLEASDLSVPSVQIGLRWYPNAISEVK